MECTMKYIVKDRIQINRDHYRSNTLNRGQRVTWFCDECNAVLSFQPGFDIKGDTWKCLRCGYINSISPSEVYKSQKSIESVNFQR